MLQAVDPGDKEDCGQNCVQVGQLSDRRQGPAQHFPSDTAGDFSRCPAAALSRPELDFLRYQGTLYLPYRHRDPPDQRVHILAVRHLQRFRPAQGQAHEGCLPDAEGPRSLRGRHPDVGRAAGKGLHYPAGGTRRVGCGADADFQGYNPRLSGGHPALGPRHAASGRLDSHGVSTVRWRK